MAESKGPIFFIGGPNRFEAIREQNLIESIRITNRNALLLRRYDPQRPTSDLSRWIDFRPNRASCRMPFEASISPLLCARYYQTSPFRITHVHSRRKYKTDSRPAFRVSVTWPMHVIKNSNKCSDVGKRNDMCPGSAALDPRLISRGQCSTQTVIPMITLNTGGGLVWWLARWLRST